MTTEATQDIQVRDKQAVEREGTRPGPLFRPDVDIVERADEFCLTADLPGVDEDHIKIDLVDGVLAIDAELATGPDPAWRELHAEYRLGGYHREFRLSETIDVNKIEASMRNGVLELRLPKLEPHRPRQIKVQSG